MKRDWFGVRANHQGLTNKGLHSAGLMKKILAKHPYPLAQGPVRLPLDCATEEYKSIGEVIKEKTVFGHSDEQNCVEWLPSSGSGLLAWGHQGEGGYQVRELKFSVQDAVSTTNMEIVYTCSKLKCTIYCPCAVCRDTTVNCKFQCRAEACRECSSQCTKHEIKMPRVFDAKTDHYTLVTQKMDKLQYAFPYAGIPVSCGQCSRDVLEHQVFHHLWHLRCKYCKNEMRPFLSSSIVSFADYKAAGIDADRCDDRTCAVCLKMFEDKYAREMHEKNAHGEEKKSSNVKVVIRLMQTGMLLHITQV